MQTEAEKYLIKILQNILLTWKNISQKIKIINLGAAQSTVVEKALLGDKNPKQAEFICDRVDIQDCRVDEPYVNKSFISALEDLNTLQSDYYDVAFANFVLEHVIKPKEAAQAMARILKTKGELVLSLSNPLAPEFLLAKLTPTNFHQIFREEGHDEAYPVQYAYKSIKKFISIMEQSGFELLEKKYFPATYSYLHCFPIINQLSRLYDWILIKTRCFLLMGHAVLHFKKK